jgi:SAM-dependent methyltransferase
MPLGWLDVSKLSIYALLLLEPLHCAYIAEREPDKAMGTVLHAHPAVLWYLKQHYPPISTYCKKCLELGEASPKPEALRTAEIKILDSMQDWLIYVLDPSAYDDLAFLGWENDSLLSMADFSDKIVIDVGSGTGRLAFTAAPQARVVYAVEPVANLRRYLWQKRVKRGLQNVYPADGTITRLPFPDNFADIIMAGHVFGEHPARELEEMTRVVKNNGMILFHPGTNARSEDEAHRFLIKNGFDVDTFEEPGDGIKRKYRKTILKN